MTTRLVIIVVLLMVFTVLLLNLDRVTTRFTGRETAPVQVELSNDQIREFINSNVSLLCNNADGSMVEVSTVLLQSDGMSILALVDGLDGLGRIARCQVSFDKYDINKRELVGFEIESGDQLSGDQMTGIVATGAMIDTGTAAVPEETPAAPEETPEAPVLPAPADTSAMVPSNVEQVAITPGRTLDYVTNKGYTITFPRRSITYAAYSQAENFGYNNVSCNTRIDVDTRTPDQDEVQEARMSIYVCNVIGDDPSWAADMVTRRIENGLTFVIRAIDPAWTTVANNIQVSTSAITE